MQIQLLLDRMAVLLAIMVIGYIARKRTVLDGAAVRGFTTLITKITMPAMILASVSDVVGKGDKTNALLVLFVSFVIIGLLCLLAFLVPKLLRTMPEETGPVRFFTVFVNNGFMGFPIVQAVFGPLGLFYASIFNIPSNLACFSLGIWFLAKGKDQKAVSVKDLLLNIANIAAMLAFAMFLLDIAMPAMPDAMFRLVGGITTPLSMLVIGACLAELPIRSVLTSRLSYQLVVLRLVLIPLLIYVLGGFVLQDKVALGTLVLIAAMPGAVMGVSLAQEYDGNVELASTYVFLSTVISAVTIPLLSLLILR